ncbi:hypothetical protein FOA52_006884 [Chlamydomonas sp. UWO 241]|nr:hypothetical protein FOA52_006884 [Chlamydomonas sp. UWO 241]
MQLRAHAQGVHNGSMRMHRACLRPVVSTHRARLPPPKSGIVGIVKLGGPANVELYEALLMLQHRGQDNAGMVTTNWSQECGYKEHKGHGMVKDVFDSKEQMALLEGSSGIAIVATCKPDENANASVQPLFVNSPLGMYMVHNGRVTNQEELEESVLGGTDAFIARHLFTNSDTEVLLNVLADELHRARMRGYNTTGCDVNSKASQYEFLFEAGQFVMNEVRGAYSVLTLMSGLGLVAFRDRHGIRPLVIGSRPGPNDVGLEYCIASEDCAFGPIGFKRVRDVAPGEMVVVTPEGQLVSRQLVPGHLTPCIFEYIYKARPDSVLNNIHVYAFQLGLGRSMCDRIRAAGWELDLICPVPDGSRPAAIQMASDLKLPYREGLVKNRYVNRTDRNIGKQSRMNATRRKLNAMPAVFAGKSVLLVDDSIVRGDTLTQLVSMIRQCGAKKVYIVSTSPAVKYPNLYGITMSYQRCSFVANGRTNDEVCFQLGADGLLCQELGDLIAAGKRLNPSIERFDASCFDGDYVTGDIDEAYLAKLESLPKSYNVFESLS